MVASSSPSDLDTSSRVPSHIAVIMDGNGRWAAERGLPRLAGHRAGVDNVRTVLEACVEFGIKHLTIYAFSTENWGRPADEVQGLLEIMAEVIKSETEDLHRNGVRVRHIGRLENIPPTLVRAMHEAMALTEQNERIILNVAFNYGGRAEIVDAIRQMLRDGLNPDSVTEETVGNYLYTAGQPDPDLIVRTGGEMRLSNFLIWQASYAEYYSTPAFWPEFGRAELQKALAYYGRRQRRFGRVLDPPSP